MKEKVIGVSLKFTTEEFKMSPPASDEVVTYDVSKNEDSKCDQNDNTKSPNDAVSIQIQNSPSTKTNYEKTQPSEKSSPQQGWKRYVGICCGLNASLLFSVAMIFVKVLPQYDPSTVGVWRFVGTFTPSFPILLYFRFGPKKDVCEPVWPLKEKEKLKTIMLMVMLGIAGASAMITQIYAIQYISLPDATVISLSTPVFVTLIARIFLGEQCGVVPVIAALLTFIGVSIIARPPVLTGEKEFDTDTLIGTSLSLGSMICSSIIYIILRFLRRIHFSLLIPTNGIVGILECGIVCAIVSRFDLPQTGLDWVYGLGAGLCTYAGQIFLTAALKYEQAGPIALTRTFDVIFTVILQLIFLDLYPDAFSLIGSSIVILAVVIVVIRKGLSTLPEGHRSRERYWCFLK